MKFIIKCPYCSQTYTKELHKNDITLTCSSCGAQNTAENIVDTVYSKLEMEALKQAAKEENMTPEEKKALLDQRRKQKLQEMYKKEAEEEDRAQEEFLKSEEGRAMMWRVHEQSAQNTVEENIFSIFFGFGEK
ncbi:MAG: hypothetical protein IJ291_03900 [Lachnospiraceae bacterium]|nr:hypothetical protein [Lachnospiraceae bacterium]